MGGDQVMAVIGIGTTSRASVEDVLAVVAAAWAKMAEVEFEASPSPHPSPARGEGAGRACGEEVLSSMARSPLPSRERGRGEGEQRIAALATLDRPALNAVLQEAARRAGLDLILLTLDELRATAHLCVTHSEHSMKQYGIPSVAEAAALAGAGAEARLLIPRFLGRNTTVSVAGRP
jgi:cobalt-precorrin 5A hydrolase